MGQIKIGSRTIGDGYPCFIVAEAGSNHNGSLDQARGLIDIAAEAGVDAVKFQVFRAAGIYPKNAGTVDYLDIPKPIYQVIKEMEMPYEWIPVLSSYCREKNLVFFAAAFDEESADRLYPYLDLFKIASYEMTHIPLVRHVAQKGKPVIISTGTATLDEVRKTVEVFRETGNDQLLLMQCTARYPAPLESINVRAVQLLKREFDVPVGLSDHSRDALTAPMAAVAIGANAIEKHVTMSNRLPGPDHPYAVEPLELKKMVRRIRSVERVLGNGEKQVHPVEVELREFARRSIFATRRIRKGEALSRENIAVLRCGKLQPGLMPEAFEHILGRRVTVNLPENASVTKDILGQ